MSPAKRARVITDQMIETVKSKAKNLNISLSLRLKFTLENLPRGLSSEQCKFTLSPSYASVVRP